MLTHDFNFADTCRNCKRRACEGSSYAVTVSPVYSSTIPSHKKKFQHDDVKRITGSNSCNYTLCQECHEYLVMGNDEWYNIWHLFMYNVLCGSHTPTFGDKYSFYMKYSAKTLWSLIPESLRHWWIDHIKAFNLHGVDKIS